MPPSMQILAPEEVSDDKFGLTEADTALLRFYSGANVFLTGATGFMGKMVLEKLLRTCPSVGTMYVLIRPKKGQQPEERAQALFDDPVFSRLLKENPKARHHLYAVAGDCSAPGLGLSEEDRATLTNNVNIILHCAATVRFDEVLDVAVNINVRGCKCVLDLARDSKNLKVVMLVSTAFANCHHKHIEEKLYDVPLDSERVIQIVNNVDTKILEKITPMMIGSWPNSYAFTKALGENVAKLHGEDLPLGIFRPAIVISTVKEPMPGWIDNLYGPGGVVLGAGMGLLHTLQADGDKVADLVPGDMAVNSLLAAAWETATMTKEERAAASGMPIYNYVSSVEKRLTWGEFMSMSSYWGTRYPPAKAVWLYSLTLVRWRPVHLLLTALLHFLPALFVDAACIAIGSPFRLVKVYKKIFKFSDVISYFATREWTFNNDRVQNLWTRLDAKDQELFPFTMRDLDWYSYYRDYILGMRLIMFKDDPKTIPQGREKRRRFYWMQMALKMVLVLLVLRVLWALLPLSDWQAADGDMSSSTSGRPALVAALRQWGGGGVVDVSSAD